MDADAAFAHLEELLDGLPAMQKQGERLARAREAARIAGLESERATRAALLAVAEERQRAAEERLARASERALSDGGDKEGRGVDDARRAVLQASSLRGFRVGPCRNAERALERALEEGPFDAVDDARAALVDDTALSSLEEEVAAYQRDYAQTLERCERAMALRSTEL